MSILFFTGAGKIISGKVNGPCRDGKYYVAGLPQTNLYLLVIEDWSDYRQSYFYNFNCQISNKVYDAGAFRIVNGTCAHIEITEPLDNKKKCPALMNVELKCSYNSAAVLGFIPSSIIVVLNVIIFYFMNS